MNGLLYHKQFSNTYTHAQVTVTKFISRHPSQTLKCSIVWAWKFQMNHPSLQSNFCVIFLANQMLVGLAHYDSKAFKYYVNTASIWVWNLGTGMCCLIHETCLHVNFVTDLHMFATHIAQLANLHYDMPNSVVRTNCSIKPTNPTGSSLTPTCPDRCFVPEVINKFPVVCLIEMNGLLYHKQFSNTYIHAQVPIQVTNKIHM